MSDWYKKRIRMQKKVILILACLVLVVGGILAIRMISQTAQTQITNDVKKADKTKDDMKEDTTLKDSLITNKITNPSSTNEYKNQERKEQEIPIEESKTTLNQQVDSIESQNNVAKKYQLPEGFVYVDDVIPNIELDIRYSTDNNFVGEKIDGYVAPLAILTTQAADALKQASLQIAKDGYHFKLYDAYRPQKAVEHFINWSKQEDDSRKEIFYPSMEKADLFAKGYISSKSRHSRGSTVDLTIVKEDGTEVDMGGYFDLLDTKSNYDTDQITKEQHENRAYLKKIMKDAGFDSIRTEWWHFQLKDEPYKETYFDFNVE